MQIFYCKNANILLQKCNLLLQNPSQKANFAATPIYDINHSLKVNVPRDIGLTRTQTFFQLFALFTTRKTSTVKINFRHKFTCIIKLLKKMDFKKNGL